MTVSEMAQWLRALERKGLGSLEVRLADWNEARYSPSAEQAEVLTVVVWEGEKILLMGADSTLRGELQVRPSASKKPEELSS